MRWACSTPRSRFDSRDLKLYFARTAAIAGKTFGARRISLRRLAGPVGYRANIFGRMDESTGAVLKRPGADRINIEVGGVTLLQFSGVSGQSGPNVDFALTSSRRASSIWSASPARRRLPGPARSQRSAATVSASSGGSPPARFR